MTIRPRNEQCPRRSIGLTHTVDGTVTCQHCGAMTMVVSNVQDLREKVIAESKPTTKQDRWWDFLRWWYRTPRAERERSNVQPIGPADKAWLEQALSKLDDLDGETIG